MKMKIKMIGKAAGILFACYLVYLITSMLVPFAHQKEVQDIHKTFDQDKYYSEDVSVDRAAMIEDNEEALSERIRLIHHAKKEILLSTFDIREGESTKDLFSALLKAADRGVKVRILVDGLCGKANMEGRELFYAASSHENIEIRFYNEPNLLMPWTLSGRLHDKYLIADNKVMILGGRNIFDHFLGDYTSENKSFDRDLLIYNSEYASSKNKESVIYDTKDYFESIWNLKICKAWKDESSFEQDEKVATKIRELNSHYNSLKNRSGEWFIDLSYEGKTKETNKVTLITGQTGIYGKEPLVWYQLTKLMEHAEERVRIHMPYAVTGKGMEDDLRRVARSVPETILMVNSVETGDNLIASGDYLLHKEDVLNTGVSLYEFVGEMSYHGKSIAMDDDITMIGSYNMDLRSTYVNTEVMLVVNSEEINRELQESMEEYERQAKQVVHKEKNKVGYATDELILPETPWYRKVAIRAIGYFVQLARYMV